MLLFLFYLGDGVAEHAEGEALGVFSDRVAEYSSGTDGCGKFIHHMALLSRESLTPGCVLPGRNYQQPSLRTSLKELPTRLGVITEAMRFDMNNWQLCIESSTHNSFFARTD